MAADKKTENGSLYEWVQAVVCSVLAAVLLATLGPAQRIRKMSVAETISTD